MQVEDRVAVAHHFLSVCLPMKHAKGATVPLRGLDTEFARGEGEQVSGDRRRFGETNRRGFTRDRPLQLSAVCDNLPCRRYFESQAIARLKIRLVETWPG